MAIEGSGRLRDNPTAGTRSGMSRGAAVSKRQETGARLQVYVPRLATCLGMGEMSASQQIGEDHPGLGLPGPGAKREARGVRHALPGPRPRCPTHLLALTREWNQSTFGLCWRLLWIDLRLADRNSFFKKVRTLDRRPTMLRWQMLK